MIVPLIKEKIQVRVDWVLEGQITKTSTQVSVQYHSQAKMEVVTIRFTHLRNSNYDISSN